jgi:hypothetical protein
MRRILVAVDDSDASKRVGEFVNEFFADLDVEILAVNVAAPPTGTIPPPMPYGWISPWWYDDYSRIAGRLGEQAVLRGTQTIADADVGEDDATVEFGDPVDVILDSAAAREATGEARSSTAVVALAHADVGVHHAAIQEISTPRSESSREALSIWSRCRLRTVTVSLHTRRTPGRSCG